MATGAAVSVLAACAALVQPRAWRALDAGRLTAPAGITIGLAVTAAGLAAAMLPGLVGGLLAAVGIGVGTGLTTPLAFASLAAATPANRLGQTMGAAELGRELGDADGPLPVAGIAVAATLTAGYAALAAILAAAPLVLWLTGGPGPALGVPASAGAWWPFAARPARRSSAWRASKITPPTAIPIPAPARTSRG